VREAMQNVLISFVLLLAAAAAPAAEPETMSSDKQALSPLQAYVGQWRGVGLPRRGSNAGAWTESSDWAWSFANNRAQLVGTLKGDKYYTQLQLTPGNKPGQFVLVATTAGEDDAQPGPAPDQFTGTLDDEVLTVTAAKPAADRPARITVRLVAGGDRMLVRYDKQLSDGVYARLAEVGSTRKGSSFAKNAAAGPECVVTGGLGTIAVEHDGKTYYVCCGGCRELFEDDPAGVLADYRERKAGERAEQAE